MLYEYLQKVKNLDIMTPPVQLNIGGKSGVKTYFGVAMTVLYLVSVGIFSYIILLTFLAKDSPTVNEEQSQTGVNPKVDMVSNSLFPVSYVLLGISYLVPAELVPKYFSVYLNKFRVVTNVLPDGSTNLTLFKDQMPVIPCKQAFKNETLAKVYNSYLDTPFFKLHGLESGLCPQFDPTESYVGGGGSESSIDVMTLEFYPCSLPNATQCATLFELLNLGIVVSLPSSSITLSNYTEPVKTYLNSDTNYFIDHQSTQRYFIQMQYNEIWDVSQYFFTESLRTSFPSIEKNVFGVLARDPTQLTCPGETTFINSPTCIAYLEFEFHSGPTKRKITRSYKTITQTLSQIGGINSMVMLVFVYINLIYNYYAKRNLLVERVFKFFQHIQPLKEPRLAKQGSEGGSPAGTTQNLGSPELDKFNSIGGPPKPGAASRSSQHHLKNPIAQLNKKELETLRSEAYEVIRKNLDVVTLVREVNNLKVLTQLLFKDYQQKLMPLISLNIQSNMDRLKKESLKSKRNSKVKPSPSDPVFLPELDNRIGTMSPKKNSPDSESPVLKKKSTVLRAVENRESEESMSFNAALLMLEEYRNGMEKIPKQEWTLEQKIALFCYEGLDQKQETHSLRKHRSTIFDVGTAADSLGNSSQPLPRNELVRSPLQEPDDWNAFEEAQGIQNFDPSEGGRVVPALKGNEKKLLNV